MAEVWRGTRSSRAGFIWGVRCEGVFVNQRPVRGLLEVLQQIPDPRGREGQRHPLSAMLAALICATWCGFRGLRPTIRWLDLHGVKMWHLLGFRRTPPVRQTFANLLARIDVEVLERVLNEFVAQLDLPEVAEESVNRNHAVIEESGIEVWDGKTLRGTRQAERRAEQLLVRMDLILGRVVSSHAIPSETNEIQQASTLVGNLVLHGKLVIADALYCQREFCQGLVDQQADYVVTVKLNQPQLLRDVEQAFVTPRSFSPLCRAAGGSETADGPYVREKSRSI